jgi:predicted HicB family RNase H-like nuclease
MQAPFTLRLRPEMSALVRAAAAEQGMSVGRLFRESVALRLGLDGYHDVDRRRRQEVQ